MYIFWYVCTFSWHMCTLTNSTVPQHWFQPFWAIRLCYLPPLKWWELSVPFWIASCDWTSHRPCNWEVLSTFSLLPTCLLFWLELIFLQNKGQCGSQISSFSDGFFVLSPPPLLPSILSQIFLSLQLDTCIKGINFNVHSLHICISSIFYVHLHVSLPYKCT